MPAIKITLSDEQAEQLNKWAAEEGMSRQDYIRKRLLNIETVYTVGEAVRRALTLEDGAKFTLPSLYKDDNPLKNGYAGVFGRQFKNYILSGAEPQIGIVESPIADNFINILYIVNKK